MHGTLWTAEEDALLRELYPSMGNADIAKAISERFGTNRSKDAMHHRARKLGLQKDREAGYVKPMKRTFWTDERREWFRSYVPGHSEGEISAEHERIFGTPLRKTQIAGAKATLGVKSGTHGGRFEKGQEPPNKGKHWDEYLSPESQAHCRTTTFAKGNMPHNTRELLDERRDEDGYWQIKVLPRNAKNTMNHWISKAQFVWMQANGQDWPEGCRAIFIDGNKDNCVAENVYPVPAELWPLVNGATGTKVDFWDRESLETAILCAKITKARTKATRRNR